MSGQVLWGVDVIDLVKFGELVVGWAITELPEPGMIGFVEKENCSLSAGQTADILCLSMAKVT
jgi:hypothetical protein